MSWDSGNCLSPSSSKLLKKNQGQPLWLCKSLLTWGRANCKFWQCKLLMGFPSGSVVKNPPAVQEVRIWSLGGEDPLEKGMGTHPSILAWRIPRTEEPGRLQSMGLQRVRRDWSNLAHTHTQIIDRQSYTWISKTRWPMTDKWIKMWDIDLYIQWNIIQPPRN